MTAKKFLSHPIEIPKKVIFGECWARDGLQNEPNVVPTDGKVEILSGLKPGDTIISGNVSEIVDGSILQTEN